MATPQQQAANGVVVGMKALTGQVQPRYDIDVLLYKHTDTFNLFVQAISELQKNPGTLGYYGLAGIHGLPTNTWDNVARVFQDRFGGYCAHGVLIFPTWHRPYLSLLEQTVYLKMVEIANKFSPQHRQKYLDAAKTFRLPYLDYFRPRDGKVTFPGVSPSGTVSFPYNFRLPDIFNERRITVKIAPDDKLEERDNPFYTYKFTESAGQFSANDQRLIKSSYSTSQTVRYPKDLTSTTHDQLKLDYALNMGREGRASLFLDLVNSTPYQNLETVASDRVLQSGDMTQAPDVQQRSDKNPSGSGSLEGSLHGNYHNLIGGLGSYSGHMSNPQVASFDPVFWFHHCQVDRVWALWQSMHPGAWFPPPRKSTDEPENKKDLLPFYKMRESAGHGTFFDSDDAKTTEWFGYIYDDYSSVRPGDKNTLWTNLQAKYTWATRYPNDPRIEQPPAEMKPLPVRSTYFFQKAKPQDAAPKPAGGSIVHNLVSTVKTTATHAAEVVSANAPTAESVVVQAQAAIQAVPEAVTGPVTTQQVDKKFDREWYVDSVVKRSAANGPFTIFFFLSKPGQVSTNPDEFIVSPFLAGINHIFAAPRETCDNCGDQEAAGQLASDTTPITPILLDYLKLPDSGLGSLQPDDVKPFLVKHLRWRVVYQSQGLQDPRQVPDFEIGVSAKVSHDDGTKTYETYPDVVPEILRNASVTSTAAASQS